MSRTKPVYYLLLQDLLLLVLILPNIMDSILNNDSDDEFESKEWEQRYSGKSGFVFLIDARKEMMIGGQESYFKKSIKCCLNAMLQIAREQRYDVVSIVFFGTRVSEGKYAPKGTVLYQDLFTPSVTVIKKIQALIEDQFQGIINKYGHENDVSIPGVLNYCKNLLHYCKTKLYTKSIVLFTCDDNPHANDAGSAFRARKRAEELRDHSIDFDVVGFGTFDSSVFYKELVLTARGELLKDWIDRDPVKCIDDVDVEVASLTKKVTRHYGMFYLGGNVQMKIIFYKLYHEPLKLLWADQKPKMLENENDNEQEKNENEANKNDKQEGQDNGISVFDQDTQEMDPEKMFTENEPSRQKPEKYPLVGGEYIPMSKKELHWYQAKVPQGLTLLGFKPISSVPIHTAYGEPYFILPDSTLKIGEELFSHFLHSCLKKSVVPVCWYSFNKTGNPALVILYPTEPAEYAKGKVHPYGFHVIKIPFADMITDFSDDLPEVESSETQINAADGIIKKTTINWTPDTFSDFEYKSRIAMIEAIAMEYVDTEEVHDETDVDLDAIGERLGELSLMFMDCSHLPAEFLGKRAADTQLNKSKPKEAKIEDPSYLISRIRAGEANKLTVAQLRELLKGEGIKSLSALNKPRLVEIANERFS